MRGEGEGNLMRILIPTDWCLFSLPVWWSLQRQQGPGVTQIRLEFSTPLLSDTKLVKWVLSSWVSVQNSLSYLLFPFRRAILWTAAFRVHAYMASNYIFSFNIKAVCGSSGWLAGSGETLSHQSGNQEALGPRRRGKRREVTEDKYTKDVVRCFSYF